MAIAFSYLPNWSNTDHANVVVTTGGVFNLEDATLRPGVRVTIVNTDHTTAVTVTPHGTQKISGAATYSVTTPATGANTSVTLLSDSGNWFVIASH